jgi:ankyrin repeat protein
MFAAQNGHIEATKLLLDHNANINLQDSDGWTALFFASYNYKPEAVEFLINSQANVNHKDNKNLNALICMLNRNPLDSFNEEIVICKQLMMAGIDINSIPIETIRTSTQGKHFEVKFSLIKNKILRAIQCDNQEEQCCYINYLITGENSLKTIPDGTTALMLASGAGYNYLVSEMLNKNAQINQINAKGFTALTYASLHNKIDVVEELLKQKAEVNHVSLVDGSTPLHHAAHKGHAEIAKLLIKNNADYNLKDMDNHTPLTLATNNGHQSAIENVIIGLLEEDASESSSSNQI